MTASLLEFSLLILCHHLLDSFAGIQKIADGGVVVQGIDDVGDIFAHITVDVPGPLQQFRGLVDQVGGEHLVDQTVFGGLIELVQSAGE